jgi:hypothetical protein
MPTKRRKRPLIRGGRMSVDQGLHLQLGFGLFVRYPFDSDAHRRRVWEANKVELLAYEPDGFDPLAKPRVPGTVPAAAGKYGEG